MKKLGRNSLALGAATLLVTAAVQFSANGAPGDVAQANASALTATGLLGDDALDLNTDACVAESADGTPVSVDDAAGNCGDNLTAAGIVTTFGQEASTGLDGTAGTSQATAAVSAMDISGLQQIDLSTLGTDLSSINTGTILDPVIGGVVDALNLALGLLGMSVDDLLGNVQDAVISPITDALVGVIDISITLPAVEARCTATAGEAPTMETTITGDVNITATLAGNPVAEVVLPVNGLTENAPLVGSIAPQEIVNAILDDVRATLMSDSTLTGALAPLADLVGGVQETLVNGVLDQLGPLLLDPLGEAIAPILEGTVNKQVTNPDGSVEVTALELNLLGDTVGLQLARAACGPNTFAAADDDDSNAVADADADDQDAVTDADADAVADADADADANADADAIADADSAADADASAALPDTGAPNLMPFFLLGIALMAFGLAVLVNERRRFNDVA